MSTVDVNNWRQQLTSIVDILCQQLMSSVDIYCWCIMSTVDMNCWRQLLTLIVDVNCWHLMSTITNFGFLLDLYAVMAEIYWGRHCNGELAEVWIVEEERLGNNVNNRSQCVSRTTLILIFCYAFDSNVVHVLLVS